MLRKNRNSSLEISTFSFFKVILLENLEGLSQVAEKAMAPDSSTLAWKIPWMEEPGRLQSMGSLRVRHDFIFTFTFTFHFHFHFSLSCIGEGSGNPLQCSCLENPRDRKAWWVAVLWGCRESDTTEATQQQQQQHSQVDVCRLLTVVASLVEACRL